MMDSFERDIRRIVREVVRDELASLQGMQRRAHVEGMEQARVLSSREAAEVAGVAVSTIRGWVRQGLVPARRAGNRLRIDRADLDEYLARSIEVLPVEAEDRLQEILREVG